MIFWGVDSLTPANSMYEVSPGVMRSLFEIVADQAGMVPTFWGRYIGRLPNGPTNNLTPEKRDFLLGRNCRILLIYAGTTAKTVKTPLDGSDHASKAIALAQGLGAPAGVWIYANTEVGWSPTADFFKGWSDTIFGSIYGGAGGVYGNTSKKQAKHFGNAYCLAYTNDPNMQGASYIWTNQLNQPCPANLSAPPPPFSPTILPCNPPTVLYQYFDRVPSSRRRCATGCGGGLGLGQPSWSPMVTDSVV